MRQSSATYRDRGIEGYDAVVLMEVVEHVDLDRLPALENSVFRHARPTTVVVTTPNADYNQLFESLPAGTMRHPDHRFEWTRQEFADWLESLERLARNEPFWRVHEPVFAVLAMESEPVDPRL